MVRVIGLFGIVLGLVAGVLIYARRDEPEQWIAFISNRDGNAEIYRMRPDGSDVQQLTHSDEGMVHCWIRWSRGGQWLYFGYGYLNLAYTGPFSCNYAHDAPEHLRMRADGIGVMTVSRSYASSWATDEAWFLTQEWDSIRGVTGIYHERWNGGQRYFLHEGLGPEWSPDGKWILFAGEDIAGLYVMRPNGQAVKRLNLDDFEIYWETAYVWSGNQVIFYGAAKSGNMPSGLYAIDVDSQAVEWVGETRRDLTLYWAQMTPSPNGKWLAYKDYQLTVVNLSTGENIELADFNLPDQVSPHQSGAFGWSPDSQWLVFSKFDEAGRSKIWRIRPDGTGLAQLTFGAGEDLRPAWSPVIDKTWDGWLLLGGGVALAGIGIWRGRRWYG